jgi:transglutaminase/protease-like cytokinesis protein 3
MLLFFKNRILLLFYLIYKMSKAPADATKKEAHPKDLADKKVPKKKEEAKDLKKQDPKKSQEAKKQPTEANDFKFKVINQANYLPIAHILKSFANDITQKELATNIPPSSAVSYEKIALYIETQSTTKEKAAFLIYDWIVQNIGYDEEFTKKKSKKPATADTAFKNKKTSCAGYADLFNKMVSKIGIKCHTLVGETRQLTALADAKEESKEDSQHAWNAIQIHNEWYFVDCTWGSKSLKEGGGKQIADYNYWIIPPKELIFTHFPDDVQWQLLDAPMGKKEYYEQPHVNMLYFKYKLKLEPEVGCCIDVNKKYNFTLHCVPNAEIRCDLTTVEESKKSAVGLQLIPHSSVDSPQVVCTFQKTYYEIAVDFAKAGKFVLTVYIRDRSITQQCFTGCFAQEFINKPS